MVAGPRRGAARPPPSSRTASATSRPPPTRHDHRPGRRARPPQLGGSDRRVPSSTTAPRARAVPAESARACRERRCPHERRSPARRIIEAAWEERDGVSHRPPGRACATPSTERWTLLDAATLRVAENGATATGSSTSGSRRRSCCPSACNEPHPGDGARRPAAWWDKVPLKFARWERQGLRGRRLPRRAGRDRAPLRLHRASVVLMPSFVNIGAYVDEGTMVDTWATVGSCAQIGKNVPPLRRRRHRRRARAAAGQPDHHRGRLLHRRPRRGGRGRHRRRGLGAVDGRLPRPRPRSSTAPPATCIRGRVPPYSVVVSGTLPGKPLPEAARAVALLRRHRQDGRRAHPREDLDQRTAQGLTCGRPNRFGLIPRRVQSS